MASGAEPGSESGKLRDCCGLLSLAAAHGLLDEEDLWKCPWREGDSWAQAQERRRALQAVREAVLGRLAAIDLAGSLRSRTEDTEGLLRAAAHKDGTTTLAEWLAFRQEWRDSPAARAGIRCTVSMEDGVIDNTVAVAEQKLMAAFMEGWGRSNAEAAWQALTRDHPEMKSELALDGLVDGLPPGSDWQHWAGRVEDLEYEKSLHFSASPDNDCFLGLARKWIVEDPQGALAQFETWETEWKAQREATFRRAEDGDFSDFNLPGTYMLGRSGLTGRLESVDAGVFLLSSWIGAQPEPALAWIESAADGDLLLGEVIAWSDLPADTKRGLLSSLRDPERRARYADNLDYFLKHPAFP